MIVALTSAAIGPTGEPRRAERLTPSPQSAYKPRSERLGVNPACLILGRGLI